ncbi:thermonuclease family protein [Mycoplasma procyoni]|uniref:thermonuclease family protein n=1 Tax=Mycoplasma procyoni TaxID=568784 RepID=UPI00197C040A|nr:thermonuclease family protein [Mycoplasma procyoni]MBN3534891.1 thermonuclease family protein [Mycoplasma procyoni]
MKFKLKTTLLPLVVFPIATVSLYSCNKYEKAEETAYEIPTADGVIKSKDATIVRWVDGDTPVIQFDDQSFFKGNKNIRIELIDTPEKGVPKDGTYEKTEGLEHEWAEKATKFGETTLPAGSKVKYVYSGSEPSQSYDRIVGSLYYQKPNDSKWYNYGIEMIRAGLTLPNVIDKAYFKSSSRIEFYEGGKIWNAFHYAWANGVGFYKGVPYDEKRLSEEMDKIYGKRGTPKFQAFLSSTEENVLEIIKYTKELLAEK